MRTIKKELLLSPAKDFLLQGDAVRTQERRGNELEINEQNVHTPDWEERTSLH